MTEQIHSPGPWSWKDCGGEIELVSGDGTWILLTRFGSFDPAGLDDGANASLIVASPDLLEALEGLTLFFRLPGESDAAAYGRASAAFWRETGLIAPGRYAFPMAGADDEARAEAWNKWVAEKASKARTAIAKARELSN